METTGTTALLEAIDELADLLRVDGAALAVIDVDERSPRVELSVSFDGVECEDCVLPPDRLHDTVTAKLSRTAGRAVSVVLHDPRRVEVPADLASVTMGRFVEVIDPTGVAPYVGEPDPGPPAGPIKGKTVAIRHDVLWASFDWTIDEWTRAFEAAGVRVLAWKRAQGEVGEVLAKSDSEWEALLAQGDFAISGLGNCGSCTSWSVRDTLSAAKRGLPAAVVATEHFEPLARILSAEGGRPGMRVMVLPYPYDTLPEDEVRAHARALFPQLLETLGATV